MSSQTTTTPGHVRALDGVRGVAVLAVMSFHFLGVASELGFHIAWPLVPLHEAGWVGVDLFFVLSGFLITSSLIATCGRPKYFRTFYGRRALRILPLYYLTLVVAFWLLPGSSTFGAEQPWFWLYGSNILTAIRNAHIASDVVSLNHFWSLAIEEQFYVVWPVLIFSLRARPRSIVVLSFGCIALSAISRELAYATLGGRASYVLTPCRLDGLALGAVLAAVRPAWSPTRVRAAGIASAAGCVAIAIWRHGFFGHDRAVLDLGLPLVAITAGAMVWCAARASAGWMTRPTLIMFGRYSYGIYVIHGLIRPTAGRVLASITTPGSRWHDAVVVLGFTTAASITSLIAAIASYRVFEQRFLRLKDRRFPSPPALASSSVAKQQRGDELLELATGHESRQ